MSKKLVLPISAMVVGYNEANILERCLLSLDFCNEIIYTDLGSKDSSLEIAKKYTTKLYTRNLVPSGEYIQSEIVQFTNNKWIIFIDPDEEIDQSLADEIINKFDSIVNDENLSAVLVPWQFYFKKKKLIGTIWGENNKKYLLVNKDRFNFLPITHYGRKPKDGFREIEIEINFNSKNVLHHYWVISYSSFLNKHFRYLKKEAIDNYNQGVRFIGFRKLFFSPIREFLKSYIQKKGYKDGFIGIFLSLFWAYYKTKILLDIYFIQKRNQPLK
jgi:hypothetical protein